MRPRSSCFVLAATLACSSQPDASSPVASGGASTPASGAPGSGGAAGLPAVMGGASGVVGGALGNGAVSGASLAASGAAAGGAGGEGGAGAVGGAGFAGAGGTASNGSAAGGAGGSGGGDVVIPGEKKPNVVAPASSSISSDYFVLGETRLINNNWGARALGCKAPYKIFVNADKTFGWTWDRAGTTCGGQNAKPDYPEVEFGMHPFGVSKQLVTSPDYPSTTVLPIQIKDVKSASATIDSISITGSDKAWNMNFEMWFTEQNPVTGTHTTAYGETMNWFGWSHDQYNWNGVIGHLDAGQSYDLFVAKDAWPNGQAQQWKYRQYRAQNPTHQFSGTVDVKKILDHLIADEHWPPDLWIARFEVGTELDDGSSGTVTIKNITFEVNGQKRSTVVR